MSHPIHNKILNMVLAIEEKSALLARVAMFATMVIITADATLRYLFNNPITGTHSVVELYLMPLLIFGVAAALQREGGNINVDILRRRFGPRSDHLVSLISRTGGLFVFGIIAILTFGQAIDRFAEGARLTGALALPTGWSWLFITIGLVGLCIRFVIQITDDVRGIIKGPDETEDTETDSKEGV